MTPIQLCIIKKKTNTRSIWIMRQAGRYLPEFRKIRNKNKNFIKLCLNSRIVPQITLQPIKRFNLDAAIIFSDILMIPNALGQKVSFSKGFGPKLENLNFEKIKKIKKEKFIKSLTPVYNALKMTSKNKLLINKDLIGFTGGPWTVLVYMINQSSPKNKIDRNFFKDKFLFNDLFEVIEEFIKLHIFYQVKNGATIIQIFDSWAGLVDEKDLEEYIYLPNKRIVDYVKTLNVPVICFPRNIKNYKEFVDYVKPDVISIDYEVNPNKILKDIKIPIQGGLDPKYLLGEKEKLKKEAEKYIKIFQNHPYIFNLGHGILPETNPKMLEYLINFVKEN